MESLPRFQVHETAAPPQPRTRSQFLTHLFFILFCLEIGLSAAAALDAPLGQQLLLQRHRSMERAVVQLLSPRSHLGTGDPQYVDRPHRNLAFAPLGVSGFSEMVAGTGWNIRLTVLQLGLARLMTG